MLFRAAILSAVMLLGIHKAVGAAVEARDSAVDAVPEIATTPYYACNCPNNCSHKVGSSCKYYSGPSDSSPVIKGKCEKEDGTLTCIATG